MVGTRIYVGGLPSGVKERDIERFFKGYGRPRDVLLKNGYGFVVSSYCIKRLRWKKIIFLSATCQAFILASDIYFPHFSGIRRLQGCR